MSSDTNKKITSSSSNYVLAIAALASLLYLLGIIGIAAVYGNNAYQFAKEKIPYYVELIDSASEAEINTLKQELETSKFIKNGSLRFVSKDAALQSLIDENLKEEDLLIFGENLLPNCFEFHLKSNYYNQHKSLRNKLMKNPIVVEVSHTEELLNPVNSTFGIIGIFSAVLSLFFIFISLILIRNTLKLSILQNIDSIKLLMISGASSDYIIKPYLRKSILNGILSGFFAIIALIITIFVLSSEVNNLIIFEDWTSFSIIFISIFFTGIIVFWISAKLVSKSLIRYT